MREIGRCRRAALLVTLGLGALALGALISPPAHAADRQDGAKAARVPQTSSPPARGEVHTLHVQGNVYMLVGAGGNITVQTGSDGVLLVDAGLASMSAQVLAAVKQLSDRPIRYIVNTHIHPDHTGGNATIAQAGMTIAGGNVVGDIGASAGNQAAIIAFQSVLDRMSEPVAGTAAISQADWPTETYTTPQRKFFFNGEGIVLTHIPAAHTDGDTIVFFRRSDVVSTGDIFVMNGYPIVDLARGGNIEGIIAGLNRIIQIAIPADEQEGGTMIIPGHGRLCDVADLVFYQEMITIIRDRVKSLIDKGLTLEQVQAARPTRDYDPRFGSDRGFWTTSKFVAAVYESLKKH